jgi:hypothetical protein
LKQSSRGGGKILRNVRLTEFWLLISGFKSRTLTDEVPLWKPAVKPFPEHLAKISQSRPLRV